MWHFCNEDPYLSHSRVISVIGRSAYTSYVHMARAEL